MGLIIIIFKITLFIEWVIYSFNSINIIIFIYFDWISMIFIFTIFLISSIIIFYCVEYISHDINLNRFFFLVLIFILSIIFIIVSPNCLRILLGWDGLGLISYCLVIYYQNYYRFNCGILTILLNRIGDVMIIISFIIISLIGRWRFINYIIIDIFILLFIIIAAFTKRAQFPFSYWLPAAMAAPTPVSSLVHSSTLVTAGIYLLIRFNYIIYKSYFLFWILITGLLTIIIAGISAIFEFDLKKIIAFSTLSQLGLIIIVYSIKFYELCFFHLIIHAMFKSIIFICSGSVIHSLRNYQDIRFFGKIINFMPLTIITIIISNFSLCGLPFISGFFSKDLILEIIIIMKLNLIIYLLLLFATFLTVRYSIRLLYYLVKNSFNYFPFIKINDFKIINYAIYVLIVKSIILGFGLNWFMFINIEYVFIIKSEKNVILILCIISVLISVLLLKQLILIKKKFIYYFFGKIYFFYNLNNILLFIFIYFGKIFIILFDKGWSEYIFKNYFFYNYKFIDFKLNFNFLIFLLLMIFIFILILIILL